jgi:hypothetical protein
MGTSTPSESVIGLRIFLTSPIFTIVNRSSTNIIIKVHPTGSNPNNQSTNQTHAKDGGDASIVPKAVQEKVPESVERYDPYATDLWNVC